MPTAICQSRNFISWLFLASQAARAQPGNHVAKLALYLSADYAISKPEVLSQTEQAKEPCSWRRAGPKVPDVPVDPSPGAGLGGDQGATRRSAENRRKRLGRAWFLRFVRLL